MSAPLLLQGNALHLPLRDGSVQCCITSPPYYGLRSYEGTATWHGGDPACDHSTPRSRGDDIRPGDKQGTSKGSRSNTQQVCSRCGATRRDAQIGLEGTLEAYLAALVGVFREVWRVLRPDGTLWLNISDSYNAAGRTTHGTRIGEKQGTNRASATGQDACRPSVATLKEKDLCMVPARLALALQADGWTLRSEIVWAKKNCMPESVQDRPTRSHEMVYLFSKQARYYYDGEAVREIATYGRSEQGNGLYARARQADPRDTRATPPVTNKGGDPTSGRNMRSVWSLATEPTPFAHFATMPTELVRRCILAGTSAHGCCAACGAPWRRRVERTDLLATSHNGSRFDQGKSAHHGHVQEGLRYVWVPTDWHPGCACAAAIQPCTILDPFCGSGTTGLVARELGRQSVLLDLSWPYLHTIARQRLGLTALSRWEGRAPAPAAVAYTDLPLFQDETQRAAP